MRSLDDIPYEYCPVCDKSHLTLDHYRNWVAEYGEQGKPALLKIEYERWVEILRKHEDHEA